MNKSSSSEIAPKTLTHPHISERADYLNADAIFVIKKIRSAKLLSEIEFHKTEYETVSLSILKLLEEISLHSMRSSLRMRTLTKRLKYALDFMRREFNTNSSRLERAFKAQAREVTASKRSSSSAISAKLLAKFIINESIRLNLSTPPREADIYLSHRVSLVQEKDMKPSSELVATLTGENDLFASLSELVAPTGMENLQELEDINPLEGIDESL